MADLLQPRVYATHSEPWLISQYLGLSNILKTSFFFPLLYTLCSLSLVAGDVTDDGRSEGSGRGGQETVIKLKVLFSSFHFFCPVSHIKIMPAKGRKYPDGV